MELLDEAEHPTILDAVGIKDAVEMIAFVLDDSGMKPVGLSVDRLAFRIQTFWPE